MDMGEYGRISLLPPRRRQDRRDHAARCRTMPASCGAIYIGVDDIDRAAEAVKAGGGQIANGPMEIPGGEYRHQRERPAGRGVRPRRPGKA